MEIKTNTTILMELTPTELQLLQELAALAQVRVEIAPTEVIKFANDLNHKIGQLPEVVFRVEK